MANKVTIGSLITLTSRDTPKAPFAPANMPAPGKDPIEQNIPAPDISRIDFSQHVAAQQPSQTVDFAKVAAPQPSQAVTPATFGDKIQFVPKVTPTSEAQRQASQAVSRSRDPAEPVAIPEPPRTKEASFQPGPDIAKTSVAAFQPPESPVVLSAPPADVKFVPGISTSKEPAGVTFLPDISLSKSPAEPVAVAEPPKTVVAADQPAPLISLTSPAATQQSQDITLSKAPAKPIDVPEFPKTVPAADQPSQDITLSRAPADPVKLDEFPKTVPAAQQPAPDLSLSKAPADPLKLDDFPKTVESPPQKSPDLGKLKDLDFQPPPPPSQPAELAFEPAPPPLLPAELPPPPDFKPAANAVLPAEPAPPPSVPAILPPPPDFKPAPNAVLPAELAPPPSVPAALPPPPGFAPNPNATLPVPPGFAPQPNATLPPPPPFAPQPNATLPTELAPPISPTHEAGLQSPAGIDRIGKDPYAPGGQLEAPKDVLGSLKRIDGEVFKFLNTLNPFAEHGATEPGGAALDPVVYAKELVRLGTQVGGAGLAAFAAQQFGLFAMNRDGQIWNPATIAPAPIAQDFVPAAIDALFLSHEDKFNQGEDRLKSLGDGRYNDTQVVYYPPFVARTILGGSVIARVAPNPGPRLVGAPSQDNAQIDNNALNSNPLTIGLSLRDAGLQTRNRFTPSIDSSVENGEGSYEANAGNTFSIGQLVDDAVNGSDDAGLLVKDPVTGETRVDIRRAFIQDPVTLEFRPDKGSVLGIGTQGTNEFGDTKLAKSFYPGGIVPAKFDGEGDVPFIYTTVRSEDPKDTIEDDDAYVPLSFMDMRPDAGTHQVKTVYFRPFITNLSEEFSPEWNKQNYFGRVDPVCSYMSTGRVINIGFIVHAFTPEDLDVIYQKLNWLTSMVYPEYDKDLLFKGGPTVRLRVGDVIKTKGGFGLPGIIESLSIDYNDVVWELKQGSKAPMGFKVSLAFQVLHDTPIGKGLNGQFGGIGTIDSDGKFVPPASAKDSSAKAPELAGDAASVFRGMGSKMNDKIRE